MEERNYYDVLGVSVKAAAGEITAAKNTLAREYHPDVHLKDGIDTTRQMQEILEAYRILSDPALRAEYDREITGHKSEMHTFDLKEDAFSTQEEAPIVVCWKASGALYEIVLESDVLFREKDASSRLMQLSMQAIKHILVLRNASVPEKYWHPDVMNWLLFTWYKNRNITVTYLLTLYDEYLEGSASAKERIRLQTRSFRFRHSVKRLIKY